MTTIGERTSYISGLGQSAVGRNLGRTEMSLTVEAITNAIADAGLRPSDIDGLVTYPAGGNGTAKGGFGGPSANAVQDALGLRLNYYTGSSDGAAQLQALVNACMAVATGLARHVVIYRTVTESTAQTASGRRGLTLGDSELDGEMQYRLPFGALSATTWLAPLAQYHMDRFGLTREQLGQVAVVSRANAQLTPYALMRGRPMTMEDYLGARMISTPLSLFDCDIPCDASTALVISHVDTAADCPHVPVQINALGTASWGRPSWDQYEDLASFPGRGPAEHMWQRTDLTKDDVDSAHIYDGFSIIVNLWLEALGFCGTGESGAFLEGGKRIARDGELPMNTNGGQLSGGRLHGFGHLHEAALQLRGEAGERQLPRQPEVSVVTNGAGSTVGCALLTRGLA
ncbi:MAG TPA: thiolase family protein [Blastococcus sp.]|jgi:acetyl-CoA acetyltransferase|nr:acetyl-CoA acetyltransferase [Blastococcus sp.]